VEVEEEFVRVDGFDAERLASDGGEVVELEGDDQLGPGGDGCSEDVAILWVVCYHRFEPFDFGGVDFGFPEGSR
jgi:hypothetical protein